MMICEAKEIVSGLADILFPPECPACGTVLIADGEQLFCPECLSTINFTTSPLCTSCGLPFTVTEGANHLCEDCILAPPPFSMARALGKYEGSLLDVIHLFKYHGNVSAGEALGRMMAKARYDSLAIGNYSLIIPVPLHLKKLRDRGFNQSLILASQISKMFSIPLDFTTLRRVIHTESQVGLSRQKRAANVRGAFEITDQSRIKNKKVLLIDDVYTTGSTAKECSKILAQNGAEEVAVLTLARA